MVWGNAHGLGWAHSSVLGHRQFFPACLPSFHPSFLRSLLECPQSILVKNIIYIYIYIYIYMFLSTALSNIISSSHIILYQDSKRGYSESFMANNSMIRSSLNPNAPKFTPSYLQEVKDFSQRLELVKIPPTCIEHCLQECHESLEDDNDNTLPHDLPLLDETCDIKEEFTGVEYIQEILMDKQRDETKNADSLSFDMKKLVASSDSPTETIVWKPRHKKEVEKMMTKPSGIFLVPRGYSESFMANNSMIRSSLNPKAPTFAPLYIQEVEDFSLEHCLHECHKSMGADNDTPLPHELALLDDNSDIEDEVVRIEDIQELVMDEQRDETKNAESQSLDMNTMVASLDSPVETIVWRPRHKEEVEKMMSKHSQTVLVQVEVENNNKKNQKGKDKKSLEAIKEGETLVFSQIHLSFRKYLHQLSELIKTFEQILFNFQMDCRYLQEVKKKKGQLGEPSSKATKNKGKEKLLPNTEEPSLD